MDEMTIEKLQHILDVDRRLNDITILESVGHGRTAEVYKVSLRDDEDKYYALKVIDLKYNFEDQYNVDIHAKPKQFEHFCEKAEKEYTNYQRVYDNEASVKHIVKLVRNVVVSNEACEYIFLLMPFYFGVLADFKEYREFDEDFVIDVSLQMLDGLKHLHDKNICHRDIKPDNVFVQLEDDQVMIRLGDLGFSREIDMTSGKGMTSIIIANNYYSAPENILSGVFTKQGDVYSVGMIMYWLCNDYDLSHTTRESKPRSKRGSNELWQIIKTATNFKPNDRYVDASQMHNALFDLKQARQANSIEVKYEILSLHYQQSQQRIKQIEQAQQQLQQQYNQQLQEKEREVELAKQSQKQQLEREIHNNNVLSNRVCILETEKARLNNALKEKNIPTRLVRRPESIRRYGGYQDKRKVKSLYFMMTFLAIFSAVCVMCGVLAMKDPYRAGQVYDILDKKEIANGYYEAAINMGDLRAASCLGNNLLETDVERGIAVLEEAESKNDLKAIYYLGSHYEGQGDFDKAIHYFEEGMNKGSTQCADALGELAYQQKDGQKLFSVAWNYDSGEHFDRNAKKAVYYYLKNIEFNPSGGAFNNLGNHYLNGTGVSKDINQAVAYYSQAREYGLTVASYNLGICYENGDKKNLAVDKEKAYAYYLEAAGQDYKQAIEKVVEMLTNGEGVQQNLEEAQEWQEKLDRLAQQ